MTRDEANELTASDVLTVAANKVSFDVSVESDPERRRMLIALLAAFNATNQQFREARGAHLQVVVEAMHAPMVQLAREIITT